MLIVRLVARFASSNHLLLERLCREHLKARPIEILSGQVEIIKDPIDFYLTLHVPVRGISELHCHGQQKSRSLVALSRNRPTRKISGA